jgi:hypothetical protein
VWRQHSRNASKTLSENNLKRELSSLDDVALFAQNYLSANAIRIWLKQMKEYYLITYIYQNSTYTPGWPTIGFILRYWRFNRLYLRYVFKNLLLMAGNLFNRAKRPGTEGNY